MILAMMMIVTAVLLPMTVSSAPESVTMMPMHGEPFQPEGVSFGQVSFQVPADTAGLSKDAWDGNIDHNTDLILISYEKDGTVYVDKTIREIKAQLGDLALVRTCYTYDDAANGVIRMNLVFHFDNHDALKPSDIISVTIKPGFVWCAGSPAGIREEVPALTVDKEVIFYTRGEAGITGVKTGNMGSKDSVLNFRFDRSDSADLKAISAVNLCPSAIPGKTLGDLVTIDGITVTELVNQGKVARFNFFGDQLVFHIDDVAYMNRVKNENLEFVIMPGFQWMNWDKDDWGNWGGTNKDAYTPVEGTLVKQPLSFYVDENGYVCIETDGIAVEPGYKDTYYVGERIDMTTLLIRFNYAGRESEVMPILESMVTYDFSQAGKATVTIVVDGMETSYTVTVLNALETETEPVTGTETEAVTVNETEEEATGKTTEAPSDTEKADGATGADTSEIGTSDKTERGCASALVVFPAACVLLSAVAIISKKERSKS